MSAIGSFFQRHARSAVDTARALFEQPLGSLLTIAAIGVALSLPAGLSLVVKNGQSLAGGWQSVRDFSVYLVPGQAVSVADSLRDELSARTALVKNVELITADDALGEFADDPGFADLLATLGDNPLPHTLVVRPLADATAESLSALADELASRDSVDAVKLDTAWVARLDTMLRLLRRAVAASALLLVGAVVIIIGNTIRLDIQNRRDEIEVAKLLGASDSFVRRPFLYTGFWYGLAGGAFALSLLLVGAALIRGPIARLAELYASRFELVGLDPATAATLVAGGLAAGLAGAWIAVSQHLRDIQPTV